MSTPNRHRCLPDHGTSDRLTPTEVSAELSQISASAEHSVRALALASFHARGLRHMTPQDLLQEAYTQLRTGQRSWPRGVATLKVFGKVMRSIASNARKKADYMLAAEMSSDPESAVSAGPAPLDTPQAAADPARIVEAESELALALQAVRGDRDMELLLETWADGIRGRQAMQELGWDAKRYDAVRKRLLRRLSITAHNGSKP